MTQEARHLAAYLYLHMGELPPDTILDKNGNVDIVADNEAFENWALSPESFTINVEEVERFLIDLRILLDDLRNEEVFSEYMTHFYNAAKRTFGGDKSRIRLWFTWLYLIVLRNPSGPRWGDFVEVYGVDNFIELVNNRLENLFE